MILIFWLCSFIRLRGLFLLDWKEIFKKNGLIKFYIKKRLNYFLQIIAQILHNTYHIDQNICYLR